jgi:hypothetical protein
MAGDHWRRSGWEADSMMSRLGFFLVSLTVGQR